ncbi:MAG: hypothetical protein ACE5IH_09635, partial [Thermodesulfobacteriota bacterium]
NRDNAITAVHGSSSCNELGWGGKPRMASPVFIRFHTTSDLDGKKKLLPIFTWCKQEGVTDHGCARNYLTKIRIGGKHVFKNNLKGNGL